MERRRLNRQKKHNEERRRNTQHNSTIPIYGYDVARLSMETLTKLNRHHIRIISKHTINRLSVGNGKILNIDLFRYAHSPKSEKILLPVNNILFSK